MRQGWSSKPLGEVAIVGAGNSAPQDKALFANGTHPFFRTSDIGRLHIGTIVEAEDHLNEQGIERLKLFPKGTILIPKSGASTFLDHRVTLGAEGYVSSHLAAINARNEIVDTRYLFYFLLTVEARALGVDSNYPTLSLAQINAISVPVPPLAEQQRIVAILDEAFEGLATANANAEKNLKNARELFDNYLNSILAQHNEWKIVSLGSASERVTVGHVGITSPHYRPAGVLFLRTQNVSKTGLVLDDVKYVTRAFHESSLKSRIEPGDILISRVITDRINCALIPPGFEEANCANVILVRPSKQLSPQYLLYYIRSKVAQNELLGRRKGSAQQVVNTKVLKDWNIKLPILSEQLRIVAAVDEAEKAVGRLTQGYDRKLASLSELRQSILQKAFSGELTLPPSSAIKEAAE